MALKIRLRQQGRKNRQTFRLVVTDIRNPRDGKYLETLGAYDPHRAENNLSLNTDRLTYWLSKGAELSERAENLVREIAPATIQDLKMKQAKARLKKIAERRRLKKKEVKQAAPAPVVKAEAPPVKKPRAVKKAKKKDES